MNASATDQSPAQPLDYITTKRTPSDRRDFNVTTIFRGLINPRRMNARRSTDIHALIDTYGWPQMLSSILLLVLSAADAVFTLIIIQRGGEELNPVMDYFLSLGTSEFVYIKMIIPTICIFFFIACWNFRFLSLFRMRTFIFLSLAIYIVLIGYELVLLNTIFPDLFNIL